MNGPGTCPLCGQPLFGWIMLPPAGATPAAPADRVIDRCESCGVAMERGREVDLGSEWEAVCRPGEGGARSVSIPDRASLQAAIGGQGWAALDLYPGRLMLSRTSLELLAQHNDHRLERMRWPRWPRGQAWMWQTLLNGLTFHANVARRLRDGSLRPDTARGRAAFVVDCVVTVLGAPLVALVSAPLELFATLARRGGELTAEARRTGTEARPAGAGA